MRDRHAPPFAIVAEAAVADASPLLALDTAAWPTPAAAAPLVPTGAICSTQTTAASVLLEEAGQRGQVRAGKGSKGASGLRAS
jgi:hypothetical protein